MSESQPQQLQVGQQPLSEDSLPPIPLDPESPNPPPAGARLSQLARERAAAEFKETGETRVQALAELRSLIAGDSQLHCRTDDAFLIKFLRQRKFNVEGAHQRIRAYLQARKNLPEVFANFNPEGARRVLESGLLCPLPYRDSQGCLMILCRIGQWDSDSVPRADLLRAVGVMMEAALEEEDTQVNGISLIIDLSGLSMRQLFAVKRGSFLKRVHEVVIKAIPVRVKQIHMLRGGGLFDFGFSLVSFMLSAKMRHRLVNHKSSVTQLHRGVDPALLPAWEPLFGKIDASDPRLTEPFRCGRLDVLSGRWDRWFEANSVQEFLGDGHKTK